MLWALLPIDEGRVVVEVLIERRLELLLHWEIDGLSGRDAGSNGDGRLKLALKLKLLGETLLL